MDVDELYSHDPLRQAKNLDIVLITLAGRSAIQGGLLPEIAFSMPDAFIQRAKELTNLGEAQALGRRGGGILQGCGGVDRDAGAKCACYPYRVGAPFQAECAGLGEGIGYHAGLSFPPIPAGGGRKADGLCHAGKGSRGKGPVGLF